MKPALLVGVGTALLLGACNTGSAPDDGAGGAYRVVNKFPHDRNAYTQGLLFHGGYLYESTGLNGRSSLRRVELESGRVLQRQDLDQRLFGEGLALAAGTLTQLTWRAGVAIVYDSDTFQPLRSHKYQTQGWGLTYDGEQLIMSDGSERLYFRDPQSFALRRELSVSDGGKPVRYLNELEYIDGEVWANVYQSNDIVRINPADGAVTGRLNFDGLLSDDDRYGGEDVLNGIAYDQASGRIFITGKLYARVYEIALD